MSKPAYDTTLARIAGNIAAGLMTNPEFFPSEGCVIKAVTLSVTLARFIVEEIKRPIGEIDENIERSCTSSPSEINALDVNRTAEALGRTRLDVALLKETD